MTEKEDRKLKGFKLPPGLIEKFEEACKGRGIQEQDGAEEALKQWTDGRRKSDKTEETMRQIRNKYEGKKCLKCGEPIPISETCWWARDVGLVCEECHSKIEIESLSDPTIAKKYRLKRELDRAIHALKTEANEISDKNTELSRRINIYEMLDELYKACLTHHGKLPNLEAAMNDFMKSDASKPEEQKLAIEKFLKAIQESAASTKPVLDLTAQIREFLTNPFLKKKKLPQIETEEAAS
jgi:hypothetical protein